MKKTDSTMCRIALLLSVAGMSLMLSCQREKISPDEAFREDKEVTTIEASLEDETESKTQRGSDLKVYWTPGDAISVFFGKGSGGGSRFVAQTEIPARRCDFAGVISVVEGGDEESGNEVEYFWSVYPYDENVVCDGKTITMTMPSVQQASLAESFAEGSALALARSLGLKLSFKNVYSGFGFYVNESGCTAVKFRGNNNEVLAGRAKVGVGSDDLPFVTEILEGATEVTLLAPEGGFETGKYYYMPFFPVTLSGGFTVTLVKPNKEGTFVYSKSITLRRNRFQPVKDLDTRSETTWSDRNIVPADIVDANFAAYLFANFDENQDNVLSVEERNKVETISVMSHNIVSGQGIEFFPNLQRLEIRGGWNDATNRWEQGSLATLNVSYNTKLKYLYCYQNQLTSLDVSKNPALQELNGYDNQFTSLDVSNNPALEQLNCSQNQLTQLDVTHNPKLFFLGFDDNQVATIDLSKTPLLEYLYASNNGISKLDVSSFPNLREFSCSNNPLTSFDISANTKLTYLWCGGLSLTSLDVSHLSQLQMLDCQNNPKLGRLDLKNNLKLTELHCWNCGLTELDITECALLTVLSGDDNLLVSLDVSGCPVLRDLYVLNNPMTTLYIYEGQTIRNEYLPEGVTKVVKAVQGMLIDETSFPDANFRAFVSENYDKDQNGELTKAELLSVTNMNVCTDNITSLEGIKYFANLSSLNCYGSGYNWDTNTASGKLTALDLSQNTSLQRVSCSSNQLTALDVSMLPELRYLYFPYNLIAALDVSHNPALQNLECYHNQLTALDVSQNSQLRSLQFENNQITALDVSHNGMLEGLYCNYNKLSSLDLSGNPELRWLGLSGNTQIASLDLSHNAKLESIQAGDTNLKAMDLRAFTQLTYVYFSSCSSLETVFLPEGLEELSNYAFAYCYALKEIQLPQSLKRIDDYAFRSCSALMAISIPASVTYIGRYAFRYCTALTRVVVYAPTPPEGGYYMFHNTNDCPIGVPESAVEAYKAAPYWSDYASRIFALGSGDNEDVGYNEW